MVIYKARLQELMMKDPNDYPWDDLRVPMQNTVINPNNSEPELEEWIDGIFAYHFEADNGADESLHFSAQIPHDWKEGSALHPHLHWAPTTTDTGGVVWEFEYILASVDETFPAAATSSQVTTAAIGTADHHQVTKFDVMEMDGERISAMILCRLTRLGANDADTFTGDAVALEFDFHYQRDSNGSYHEYDKLRGNYIDMKADPVAGKQFRTGAW